MSYFILVDCNNFYASCERLFNPQLELKPVIVLSNNDGCVVARSQEAKAIKIKMGEPFFKIRDLCRQYDVAVFSSNYRVYGDISQRVMSVLSEMTQDLQVYSIDEAFLVFPLSMTHEKVVACGHDIRRIVKKWVGIPTSIGIAPTKTLAKIANDMAKKDRKVGLFDLTLPDVQHAVLKNYPIEEVWGIGSRLSAQLKSFGIYTAAEFRDMDPVVIRRKMGVVGERMLWELRGVSCLPLEEAAPKKSITCSRSFGNVVTEATELGEALATFSARACQKLREQNSCAKALTVFLEAALDPQEGTRQHFGVTVPFLQPTNDTSHVISIAKKSMLKLYCKGLRFKKCGVILLDLISEKSIIPDLFLGGIDPKRKLVMQTVDALNARFGKNTLFYGAMGINPAWRVRSDRRSRHYTTSWDELPIALASP